MSPLSRWVLLRQAWKSGRDLRSDDSRYQIRMDCLQEGLLLSFPGGETSCSALTVLRDGAVPKGYLLTH